MNNVLVAIAVFVIAVLGAAFAVPRAVDWDSYRGVIEEEATRLLGRDVRVGGGVKISLLPAPVFSADRIVIADTQANTGQPFLQAATLSGRLAVAPLLRGILQATDMALSRPEVHFVLDGEGGGNWKSLGQGHGPLPFFLSEVALDQVRINQGTLVVHGPDRTERLRLDEIDGVLSAVALEGPFRFRGSFGAQSERRDLRVSTNRQEADGSIRFKAALQALDTGAIYNFDGRVVDISRIPHLEGELSAKVAIPQLTGAPHALPKVDDAAPLELRAALTANLKLVKLANLNLTFEQSGRPQILTGEAAIDVSRTVELDARLAAKWLDLDQVIGVASGAEPTGASAPGQGPIQGLISLVQRLNGFAPEQGRLRLNLDVEQANLGGEAVSGLRMTIAGKGAETEIKELRLGLPGGTQADVKGLMTGSGVETTFDGDIVLRGASLARFVSWASRGATKLDAARDGAFAMRSKVVASPSSVMARDFTGEVGGTIMQGELGYRWQTRPEISVLIEGPRVDLRPLFAVEAGNALSLAEMLRIATTWGMEARGGGKTDAVLRIRAGELLLPAGAFVDAALDLEARDGQVRVGRVTLAGEGGLAIDLEGDLPTVQSQSRGVLRGTVAASTALAVRTLASLLSVPTAFAPDEALAAALAPLRLAGVAHLAAEPAMPVALTMDGEANGTRVATKASLRPDVADWTKSPIEMALSLSGPRATELARRLGRLAPNDKEPGAPLATDKSKRIEIQVSGIPAAGLLTYVSLGAPEARLVFHGRTSMNANLPVTGEGRLRFDGVDLGTVVSLLMSSPHAVMPTSLAHKITGQARLNATGGATQIEAIDVKVGAVGVRGTLKVATAQQALDGQLALSSLEGTALLQPLVSGARAVDDAAQTWPGVHLSARGQQALEANVGITTRRLDLPGGLALDDASFRWIAHSGRVEVRDLQGRAAGGVWSGGVKLETTREGAAATLALRFKDVNPARAAVQRRFEALDTPLSGVVTLTGRGATLNDLVGSLSGRGSLSTGAIKVATLSPQALSGVLQGAVRGPADALAATIQQGAESLHQAGRLELPARMVDIEVKNGVLAMGPVAIDVAGGRVAAGLSIDLNTMRYATQWRVTNSADPFPPPAAWDATVVTGGAPSAVVPQPKRFEPLPPVVITTAGPLIDPSRARFEINVDELVRDLAVRKVERDLEDLERLRKLDEDRARAEAERRKAENAAETLPPPAQPVSERPTAGPENAASKGAPLSAAAGAEPSRPQRPAPPPMRAPPAPQPAVRPLNSEEHRKIFGGG